MPAQNRSAAGLTPLPGAPGVGDQAYDDLTRRSQEEDFIARVQSCILHTAVNVKIKGAATDPGFNAKADALGRSVVADPQGWARRFAFVVGVILIGSPDLSEASVPDGALFSAVDAAWPKFYPGPD